MDRRAVADRLAALRRRVGIEDRGEEDQAAARVELEDLRRVRRQAEAVVAGPLPDLGCAALEDGHVEGVDADLHQHLGARRRGAQGEEIEIGSLRRVRFADESLEGPVAALLDVRGDAGEGVIEPKAPPPPWNWNAVT